MNQIQEYRQNTQKLAHSLKKKEIYSWLAEYGYYPEAYVLPPCFRVTKYPKTMRERFQYQRGGNKVPTHELTRLQFPKSEYTDRTFSIINAELHNDISVIIAKNWKRIIAKMFNNKSLVTSYSFPVPVNKRQPGRVGYLRSGRMIYEYLDMIEDDLASETYKYSHVVKADIKNFYPSIYTHSISWALHTKKVARSKRYDYSLYGNKLDKLFQSANDGCTNGIPIGPVVSDIIAEIIACAVDSVFCKNIKSSRLVFEAVRFKDDYRFLVKSIGDGKKIIKHLQLALKEYNLELSDEKTTVSELPDGLFREWATAYHQIHPFRRMRYDWKQFRELFQGVVQINKKYPGTGVFERFLSDIVNKEGVLKVRINKGTYMKVISMLLTLGKQRIKSYPRILAIIEKFIDSSTGRNLKERIYDYLSSELNSLLKDEARNRFLIVWLIYFLKTNYKHFTLGHKKPIVDPIIKCVANDSYVLQLQSQDFHLYHDSRKVSKKISLLRHLDVFNPPTYKNLS